MKKVVCSQMRVIAETDFKSIHGCGAGANGTSRSDSVQTALSGDRGCVAGARDAQRASGKGPR